MIAIAGGSASTGSSLMVRILNRHSQILCGPETSLFARPQMISDWNAHHKFLCGKHFRKLHNQGWHRYYGITWDDSFYGITRPAMCNIANKSHSFKSFIESVKKEILTNNHKGFWVEKTPSNVYSFRYLRDLWPENIHILTIRHPADAIASMVQRGMTPLYAASLYLLNTSFGYLPQDQNLIIIRYEKLVSEPEATLAPLLSRLGVSFEPGMLKGADEGVQMTGWQFNEGQSPRPGSVGRFKQLDKKTKDAIGWWIHHLKIRADYTIANQKPTIYSIAGICDTFGYQKPALPTDMSSRRIKNSFLVERIKYMLAMKGPDRWTFPLQF